MGLLLAVFSFGQILKIQTGISLSSLNWKLANIDRGYNQKMIGYSAFAGLDYCNKKYYNLSANAGFIRKGGKLEITITDDFGNPIKVLKNIASLDYISLNTTIDFKYPIKDKLFPFIGFGPRFDYMIFYSHEFDGFENVDGRKKYSLGMILGGGFKYDLPIIQVGLRADFNLNFTKIADWPATTTNLGGSVIDHTMMINLSIGYKLN